MINENIPARPFISSRMTIEEGWIDYNGHLNMAFYNVLFDRCVDEAFELIGLGPSYIKERNLSFFTAEVHICYLQELHQEHSVVSTFQLLEFDAKKVRFFQELRHADEGWVAATSEQLSLHVDMNVKKVSPFPQDILENLEGFKNAQKEMPWPERAGKAIALKR